MRHALRSRRLPVADQILSAITYRWSIPAVVSNAVRASSSFAHRSTFVSKHVELPLADIEAFLNQRNLSFRRSGSEVVMKDCPFCHETHGKADNMWKLYIGVHRGGAWMCHRCAAKGSWWDLRRRYGNGSVEIAKPHGILYTKHHPPDAVGKYGNVGGQGNEDLLVRQQRQVGLRPIPDQVRVRSYPANLMHNPRFRHVKEYLSGTENGQRGIKPEVLIKYGVGCAAYRFPADGGGYVETESITFPWVLNRKDLPPDEVKELDQVVQEKYGKQNHISDTVVVRVKARAVEQKRWQRLDPSGGRWGIFGLHTVPADAKEVVLTEGEFDAMAVYQAVGVPAVSLPNGASSLPPDVLPHLERFEKIYLWMDHDGPGHAGAEKFVRKLGTRRCVIVQAPPEDPNPPKDANEALLQGKDIQRMLDGAEPMRHQDIQTFGYLRQKVLHELQHPLEYRGTALRSFPRFTRIIKGLRRGELTIVTGPTGSGKTTILSQLALDLAEGGNNTLWGSFEIKNTRLMLKMLQQFARKPLDDIRRSPETLNSVADRFQALPLGFMRFHGSTDVDEVVDTMEYAVYANDVHHIIIDNLQFMLTRGAQEGSRAQRTLQSWDKFDAQDIALDKFRKFATEKNVHVTLVIHPRKEDESQKLTTSSIFGSAKATQEADLVIILQNQHGKKSLEVKKNRFDGDLGEVSLTFDAHSSRLLERA